MLHWIDECFVCSNSMKENVNNYLDYPQEHIHVIGECAGACLKNHSRDLHSPLCGEFIPNLINIARYAS